MAEERLRRNLDIALDAGPDFPSRLWLSRTMAAIEKEAPRSTRARGIGGGTELFDLLFRSRRLAAVVALIALAVGATAGLLAIHSKVGPAPAPVPSTTGKADVREYPFPVGSKYALGPITVGPDGNVFIGAGPAILKMTQSGTITEYKIQTNDNLPIAPYQTGMTIGPDGNIWFTEYPFVADAAIEGRVFKMTISGIFTEYTIPLSSQNEHAVADFGPEGITAGPDGNLWFIEPLEDTVAKMTTAGDLTEYPAPDGTFNQPATNNPGEPRIVAGPDGNLWFVEPTKSMVAKMTTSGRFVEFSLPRADYEPTGITAGPDGNLWVTEVRGGAPWGGELARLTPSGKFTEFRIPNAGYLWQITAGRDGSLWFIDDNKVARMSSAGVVTEYKIPAFDGSPTSITASGTITNLSIWFLTLDGGVIGVLTPHQDP